MNAFVVRDMELSNPDKQLRDKLRTFPIFYDDPLEKHLVTWVNSENVKFFLFPSNSKTGHITRERAWGIVTNLGKRHFGENEKVTPETLREQRMKCLEERGFSPYDIQKYLKLIKRPPLTESRDSWKSLLYVIPKHKLGKKLEGIGLEEKELQKLANKQRSFFSSETWANMSLIEKSDFADAAKCLLAELPTPAVMVALRGAEASVRSLYTLTTGKKPTNKDTWVGMTTKLKKRINIEDRHERTIEENFISSIAYCGNSKRNPALHPNKIYSMDDAVDFFFHIVSLVSTIYTRINELTVKMDEKRKKKKQFKATENNSFL